MYNKYKLKKIINLINENKDKSFSGTGLIIYENLPSLPVEPLINNNLIESDITDDNDIVKKLLLINKKSCIYHDGFHLLDKNINLTHLSYYFSTPINKTFKPKLERGSRYRTAFYGSLLDDVLCTVIIGYSYEPIFFVKGKELSLDEF
ncbi:Uncharacterised protein [Chryseobacterium nakagawai]|uniref:Uncharacterized protein n=1 Tax=Chryseobacterium nakagawai TaxID=1241982 RepID=A0AAD1DSM7_CHRNA|nr:hypothetical protein [Chryseobacterium nakagawai]AZA92976.1 hypothetical protein EG343_21435 [Chryseobacterium nakagawai]VEH19603.1 Uncharacterised protein [Chryseobacterium nakagawai]